MRLRTPLDQGLFPARDQREARNAVFRANEVDARHVQYGYRLADREPDGFLPVAVEPGDEQGLLFWPPGRSQEGTGTVETLAGRRPLGSWWRGGSPGEIVEGTELTAGSPFGQIVTPTGRPGQPGAPVLAVLPYLDRSLATDDRYAELRLVNGGLGSPPPLPNPQMSDTRIRVVLPLPDRDLPAGHPGMVATGTEEHAHETLFVPSGGILVSHWRPEEPNRFSTLVYDVSGNKLDKERAGPLDTAWRVASLADPALVIPNDPVFRPPAGLAWVGLPSPEDARAGRGLTVHQRSVFAPSLPASPEPPIERGRLGDLGDGGTIVEFPPAGGPGRIVQPGGRRGPPGILPLPVAGVAHAYHALEGGGPLTAGGDACQHRFWSNADGEPFAPGHLQARALWWADDDFDAPLEFQLRTYPDPAPKPYTTRVHLVYDEEEEHRWFAGTPADSRGGQGLWRWYAESIWSLYTPPPWTPIKPPPLRTPDPKGGAVQVGGGKGGGLQNPWIPRAAGGQAAGGKQLWQVNQAGVAAAQNNYVRRKGGHIKLPPGGNVPNPGGGSPQPGGGAPPGGALAARQAKPRRRFVVGVGKTPGVLGVGQNLGPGFGGFRNPNGGGGAAAGAAGGGGAAAGGGGAAAGGGGFGGLFGKARNLFSPGAIFGATFRRPKRQPVPRQDKPLFSLGATEAQNRSFARQEAAKQGLAPDAPQTRDQGVPPVTRDPHRRKAGEAPRPSLVIPSSGEISPSIAPIAYLPDTQYYTPVETAGSSHVGIPMRTWVPREDLRYRATAHTPLEREVNQSAPATSRLQPYGLCALSPSKNPVWTFTHLPGPDAKTVSGTGPGGVAFLPPELGIEDVLTGTDRPTRHNQGAVSESQLAMVRTCLGFFRSIDPELGAVDGHDLIRADDGSIRLRAIAADGSTSDAWNVGIDAPTGNIEIIGTGKLVLGRQGTFGGDAGADARITAAAALFGVLFATAGQNIRIEGGDGALGGPKGDVQVAGANLDFIGMTTSGTAGAFSEYLSVKLDGVCRMIPLYAC